MLSAKVSNTDYASSSVGGVIKANANALYVSNSGLPYAMPYTYQQYQGLDNTNFIGKGTLENVITGKLVEKEAGKGLSSNDFTDAYKNKLDGLENYDDTAISGRVSVLENELSYTGNFNNVISLKNTANTPFRTLNIIGNMEQDTTQGFNLLPLSDTTSFEEKDYGYKNIKKEGTFYSGSGITLYSGVTYYLFINLFSKPSTATSFTAYKNTTASGASDVINDLSIVNINNLNLNQTYEYSFTPSEDIPFSIRSWGNSNSETYEFQLWLTTNNTKGFFEKYTGGASSPSVAYPQPIKIATGSNKLTIHNENYFDGVLEQGGLLSGLNIAHSQRLRTKNYIPIQQGKTYTIKMFRNNTGKTVQCYIAYYDKDDYETPQIDSSQYWYSFNNKFTFSPTYNAKFIRVAFTYSPSENMSPTDDFGDIMIVEGSSAPTNYVAQTSKAYPLDLSSKNLLNVTATTQTISNVTITVNADKSIKLNGTASAQIELGIGNCGKLKAGTYKGNCQTNSTTGTYYIRLGKQEGASGTWIENITNNTTITLSEDTEVWARLIIKQNTALSDVTIYPQIEKGDTATDYEPYYNYELGYAYFGDSLDTSVLDYIYKNGEKWFIKKKIFKIASYNGETISGNYVSTTGSLTTGATVYYTSTAQDIEITPQKLKNQLDAINKSRAVENNTVVAPTCEIENSQLYLIATAYHKSELFNFLDKLALEDGNEVEY